DIGPMDRTHLRFFTRRTLRELVSEAGLVAEREDFTYKATALERRIAGLLARGDAAPTDAAAPPGGGLRTLVDAALQRAPGVLDGAGDSLTWFGGAWRIGHGEPDDGRFDSPRFVLSACGGAALYRRTALEEVGRFDASFFAYLEDMDWGVRAQLLGWRCRY